MIISVIVATDLNGCIGKGNTIPWHLPADLKYFKAVTTGHAVLMGRKCYESIGRPLPNRTNLILSRDPSYKVEGCITFTDFQEAVKYAESIQETELFVIGGGEIYEIAMPYTQKLYRTFVNILVEQCEVFMPKINNLEWHLDTTVSHKPDEKNNYAYTFDVYHRI